MAEIRCANREHRTRNNTIISRYTYIINAIIDIMILYNNKIIVEIHTHVFEIIGNNFHDIFFIFETTLKFCLERRLSIQMINREILSK